MGRRTRCPDRTSGTAGPCCVRRGSEWPISVRRPALVVAVRCVVHRRPYELTTARHFRQQELGAPWLLGGLHEHSSSSPCGSGLLFFVFPCVSVTSVVPTPPWLLP